MTESSFNDTGEVNTSLSKSQRSYGANFPGFDSKDAQKWQLWAEGEWAKQRNSRTKRLHASRHRHFRQGRMWITTRDGKTLHEPGHDKNTIRVSLNLIGPALDYRLGVLREQRPGFKFQPLGSTVQAKEQAQAQQITVEYYLHILRAWMVFQDAFAAAQTDGVAFLHVFKDKQAGDEVRAVELIAPDDERFPMLETGGYTKDEAGNLEVPLDEARKPRAAGEAAATFRKGDIGHRVVYMHETLSDVGSKTINGPYDKAKWFIIRRVRDVEAVRQETGNKNIEPDVESRSSDPLDNEFDNVSPQWNRGLPKFPTTRRRRQNGVFEYLVFFNGGVTEERPDGAWRKIIGKEFLEGEEELPGGVIPIARITDGSSDPDLYPRAVMSDWVGDNITINALISTAVMHARVMGGGRALVQQDTVINESFSGILGSLVEYSGIKPEFITPPRVGGDVWSLITFLVKKLEDKTAWNDLARGQVTGAGGFQDVSGRAVLGAKELLERAFGPMVRSSADGITEWSNLIVIYAAELFDEPRMLPIMGGRGDLAKKISKEMLSGPQVVYADPRTLMPMPKSAENQMLFDLLEKGLIDEDEYKDRAPYAFINDVHTGRNDQVNRAQAVNEVIIENWESMFEELVGDPLALYTAKSSIPILWQDDPQVHRKVLNQLVLDDRKPWQLRQLAIARYNIYEELEDAQKAGSLDQITGQPFPDVPVPLEVVGAPANKTRTAQPEGVPEDPQLPSTQGVETGDVPGAPATIPAAPIGKLGAVENQLVGDQGSAPGIQ